MKKIILGCLILIIVTSIVAFAANIYLANSNVIRIGAEDVKFNNEIYLIDEKTYVPIRELSEKMQVPIIWNEEDNKVELLTDHKTVNTSKETIINEEGVIPDAETAYRVGKIILEKYVGKSLEYETEKGVYYLQVEYHKLDNSWRVSQECEYKIGGGGGTGIYSPTIVLNKNTGEVMYINTHSVID